MRPAPTLTPVEVAYGLAIGVDPCPPLARRARDVSPRAALEAVLAEALSRPPCLVSFSGGRDSSALLSVAVHVARREGLAHPIPATLVFPGVAATDEDEWQSLVLAHLGVEDRVRIEVGDELDAVGPVAAGVFGRHGVVWPFNAHFHQPIIERAAGGTVVTGFGGDELARSSVAARAERVLTRRRRPRWDDLLVVGLATSPRPVRTAVHRRRAARELDALPWLTAHGRRRVAAALGAAEGAIPLGWEAVVRRWIWRDRYFRLCVEGFAAMAADHDVRMVHPFVAERVLDALASAGGFTGLGDRTQLMADLFGDLLPDQVVRRPTKGAFTDPLWTATALAFAREWSGQGLDEELVDPGRLRAHWLAPGRNLLSTTLLQHAWYHDHGGAREA